MIEKNIENSDDKGESIRSWLHEKELPRYDRLTETFKQVIEAIFTTCNDELFVRSFSSSIRQDHLDKLHVVYDEMKGTISNNLMKELNQICMEFQLKPKLNFLDLLVESDNGAIMFPHASRAKLERMNLKEKLKNEVTNQEKVKESIGTSSNMVLDEENNQPSENSNSKKIGIEEKLKSIETKKRIAELIKSLREKNSELSNRNEKLREKLKEASKDIEDKSGAMNRVAKILEEKWEKNQMQNNVQQTLLNHTNNFGRKQGSSSFEEKPNSPEDIFNNSIQYDEDGDEEMVDV